MATAERIVDLLIARLEGELSGEGAAELQAWAQQSAGNRRILEEFETEEQLKQGIAEIYQVESRVWERLEKQLRPAKIVNWKKWVAAASILIAVATIAYLVIPKPKTEGPAIAKTTDIEAPKNTRATITLADGRSIPVDSLTTITQGDVVVLKDKDGKIIYQSGVRDPAAGIRFNTLSNPRGSKVIDMTLSDGSRVWLNAGSSLTYPVAFTGNERKLSITGEAYFEVAHDKTKPFTVSKDAMEVTVLGTHFNVNAYDDEEDIKVTLLEGSVNVSREASVVRIKPGEQARVSNSIKVIGGVDVDEVMAWKNGKFKFNNTNIREIMREAARWYDVEIEYRGDFRDLNFGGSVSRQSNISSLLKRLEATEAVTFRVEGRKVIVTR